MYRTAATNHRRNFNSHEAVDEKVCDVVVSVLHDKVDLNERLMYHNVF